MLIATATTKAMTLMPPAWFTILDLQDLIFTYKACMLESPFVQLLLDAAGSRHSLGTIRCLRSRTSDALISCRMLLLLLLLLLLLQARAWVQLLAWTGSAEQAWVAVLLQEPFRTYRGGT